MLARFAIRSNGGFSCGSGGRGSRNSARLGRDLSLSLVSTNQHADRGGRGASCGVWNPISPSYPIVALQGRTARHPRMGKDAVAPGNWRQCIRETNVDLPHCPPWKTADRPALAPTRARVSSNWTHRRSGITRAQPCLEPPQIRFP